MVLGGLVAAALPLGPIAAQTTPREPLTVMSFNIRYGTAKDGENHWTARREMLFDVIREQDADLVGLQEALASQIDEIIAAVPIYAVVGVGRDDAARAGEFSAILFRKDRLRVAEAGTFWFSDTPSVPASKSWGNNITRISHVGAVRRPRRPRVLPLQPASRPRIATVARAQHGAAEAADRRAGGAQRSRSSSPETSTSASATRRSRRSSAPGPGDATAAFVDTFRVRHPDDTTVGTFTAFKFGATGGDKIDYVLVQPGTEVLGADIVRTSRNDRYPSDHFPVVAKVRLPQ